MEKEQTGASPSGSGYSSSTEPQSVSALTGEYPSREAREIIHEIADMFPASDPEVGFTPFEDWYLRLWRALRSRNGELERARLEAEVARLTQRLIDGPANMQECAEFCRVARENGDGKPCLDCHPENFTF